MEYELSRSAHFYLFTFDLSPEFTLKTVSMVHGLAIMIYQESSYGT